MGLAAAVALGWFTPAASSEVVQIDWRFVNVEVAPKRDSYSLPLQMTFVADEDRLTDIYNVTVTPGQVRRGVSKDGFPYSIHFDAIRDDAVRRVHIASTQTSGLRVDLELKEGGQCAAAIRYFFPHGHAPMPAWREESHEHVTLSHQYAADIACSVR